MVRGAPRPVDDEGAPRTGRNTERCEALQASKATIFLTGE